ncbi:multidrug efflux system outer membrane protein [Stenotrophomonas maltophilia]|uniref:efflux transporter outer membrane subunit n=1 Tax=Stenotrophomonas chelatiphaga TaxID=517011 RepID=UPI000F4CEA30|nr:efflux transporter outer membrane subunit [Stenotrophomonas chelatiphaga]MCS4230084.1 multidrug efflux system outer membrane protein [Stenotrophomonas chelatiphaga]ROQ45694.1 multidrug efflux system outer membrane protein [Stenotrophomonas maltophilia]
MNKTPLLLALIASLGLGGCATLVPGHTDVAPSIPAQWPAEAGQGRPTDAAELGWRDFFTDPRLQQVIEQGLANNRDLRVAVLNVERARGQYRIQRADRVPALNVQGQMERTGGDLPVNEQFTAGLGVTEFELDLFGRVRNLSEAALQQYFAVAANRRNAQLSLVAETATAWLTFGADSELLRISEATLASHEDSLRLAQARFERGGSSALELAQTRTLVETARTDAARLRGQLQQDRNALALLIGGPVDAALLPVGNNDLQLLALAPPPADLPSDVLLRRPDIMAAEHTLLAGNANIGAARAAFFPSIRLTGTLGSSSTELSGLFDSGTRVWSFLPTISLPIFQGGKLRAGLAVANADRDIALAEYEKSIQVGFRETADALALSTSLDAQAASQQALLAAATQAEQLSQARYDAGLDSFVTLLDARRTAYSAQQSQLQTALAQQSNRITLYKVLGGGWRERS